MRIFKSEEQRLRQYSIEGYRYALSLSHNVHDAEDLVQEAVARLYKSYGKIRHKNLLYRAIRNLYFDQWRRSKVVPMESLEELASSEGQENDPQSAPGGSNDLEEALSVLRAEERELVFLRYNEGYSASEIGKLVGKGRGTVLTALYRAEGKMKRHMQQDLAEEEAN